MAASREEIQGIADLLEDAYTGEGWPPAPEEVQQMSSRWVKPAAPVAPEVPYPTSDQIHKVMEDFGLEGSTPLSVLMRELLRMETKLDDTDTRGLMRKTLTQVQDRGEPAGSVSDMAAPLEGVGKDKGVIEG